MKQRRVSGSAVCLVYALALSILPTLWLRLRVVSNLETSTSSPSRSDWSIRNQLERRSSASEVVVEDYRVDIVCPDCRHSFAKAGLRCGATLPKPPKGSDGGDHQDMIQAAMRIAQEYPENCAACNPDQCSPMEKKFWRYDRVGLEPGEKEPTPKPFLLSAVPSEHRIPTDVKNITDFFLSIERKRRGGPLHEFYFDYNPSIVVLTEDQRKVLKYSNALYLASFRVSNQHYCFHPFDQKLMNGRIDGMGKPTGRGKPTARNWLGLALLDRHLNVLADTVVDLQRVGFANAEDFRLFAIKEEIYISSYDVLAPLSFTGEPGFLRMPTVFASTENMFGPVYVRSFVSCSPCEKKRGFCGKNFNYFAVQNGPLAGKVFAEIWPSHPHLLRGVDLGLQCNRREQPKQFLEQPGEPSHRSYATVESILYPKLSPRHSLLTRGRGGACCIELEHEGKKYLVGVRHSKTPSQGNRLPGNVTENHYLSQLYAFQSVPPFTIVAESGFFCLGFGKESEHPMVRHTNWRKLWLGTEFQCPRIHFVSGISLSADDPSLVIVSFGVNDCYSRMVFVPLQKFKAILFSGISH